MRRHDRVIFQREERYQRQKLKARQALQGVIFQPALSIQNTAATRFLLFLMLSAQLIVMAEGAKTQNKNPDEQEKTDNSPILTVELTSTYSEPETILSTHSIKSLNKAPLCQESIPFGQKNINVRCSDSLFKHFKGHPTEYAESIKTLKEIVRGVSNNKESFCKMESIINKHALNIELTTVKQAPPGVRAAYDHISNSVRLPSKAKMMPGIVSVLDHEFHHYFLASQNRALRRNYRASIDNSVPAPYDKNKPKAAEKVQNMIDEGLKNIRSNLILLDVNDLFQHRRNQYTPTLMIKSHYEPVASRYNSNKKLTSEEQRMLKKLYVAVEQYVPQAIPLKLSSEQTEIFLEKKYIDKDYNLLTHFETSAIPDNEFDVHVIATEKVDQQTVRIYVNTVSEIKTPHQKLKAALLDGYYLLQPLFRASYNPQESDLVTEADAFAHQIYGNYSVLFELLFPQLRAYHRKEIWDDQYRSCYRSHHPQAPSIF